MFESDTSSSKNSVQAKIEKMFNEVAKDSGKFMFCQYFNNKHII